MRMIERQTKEEDLDDVMEKWLLGLNPVRVNLEFPHRTTAIVTDVYICRQFYLHHGYTVSGQMDSLSFQFISSMALKHQCSCHMLHDLFSVSF